MKMSDMVTFLCRNGGIYIVSTADNLIYCYFSLSRGTLPVEEYHHGTYVHAHQRQGRLQSTACSDCALLPSRAGALWPLAGGRWRSGPHLLSLARRPTSELFSEYRKRI